MERILGLVISDTDAETTKDNSSLIPEDLYHPSLSIMWNISSNNTSNFESRSSTTHYNFRKANYVGLYNALSYIDWSILDGISDVNILCDLFYQRLYYVLDLSRMEEHKRKRINTLDAFLMPSKKHKEAETCDTVPSTMPST
nr:unnamed protein product [Callosobruchus analis]